MVATVIAENITSNYMQYSKDLGSVVLRGHRLYWIKQDRYTKQEVDITPIWHFFQELQDYTAIGEPSQEDRKV